MSIAEKTGQSDSILDGSRKLELFTNRSALIKLFLEYLNEAESKETILFLHGDSGNGKTILTEYLRKNFCKKMQPDVWEFYKHEFNELELINTIKNTQENFEPVPVAVLNFDTKVTNIDRPKEFFYGLTSLRRQLSLKRIGFPLFDFACIWYLHKTNQLDSENLKILIPPEELDLFAELIDGISNTSWGSVGKVILNIFSKNVKTQYTIYSHKRGLEKSQIEQITQLEDKELSEKLPDFFAQDLNNAIKKSGYPSRIVLFFDTYESFWGYQRKMPMVGMFDQEKWLRRLLCSLELGLGIIVVVASRELPAWHRAPDFFIPEENIDSQFVGFLSCSEADEFLLRAQIIDETLRQQLVSYVEGEPNEIHPGYLGLCLDVILTATRGEKIVRFNDFAARPQLINKEIHLINLFLSYADLDIHQAVIALSACRMFDKNLFVVLGEALNFDRTTSTFEILTGFSFVSKDERPGDESYKIHRLLRKLFTKIEKDKQISAHQVLERYYRHKAQTDELAVAEAIYHTNCQDWQKSIKEWVYIFGKNLDSSRFDFCRNLLEIRRELEIYSDFYLGLVTQLEGEFYLDLSYISEANLCFKNAVLLYDKYLTKNSDDHITFNKRGIVQRRLGEINFQEGYYDNALQRYNAALDSFERSLTIKSDFAETYDASATTYRRIGDLQLKKRQLYQAINSYNLAISSYNQSIKINRSSNHYPYSCKGTALRKRGDLEVKLNRLNEAKQSYYEAIENCEVSIEIEPNLSKLYDSLGNAWRSLGNLDQKFRNFENASSAFNEAYKYFQIAISIAPNNVYSNNNSALVLETLGNMQLKRGRIKNGCELLKSSLESYEIVLTIAPKNKLAHRHKQSIQVTMNKYGCES